MLPLVGRTPQHEAVLHPDAHAADVEARLLERAAEVEPLGIRVEDVGAAALSQMCGHIFERRQQEFIERRVTHAVVLDGLAVCALVGDVVGRVGDDKVGLEAVHEQSDIARVGSVAADHAVAAQRPDVARPHERDDLLRVDVAVIVGHILVMYLRE